MFDPIRPAIDTQLRITALQCVERYDDALTLAITSYDTGVFGMLCATLSDEDEARNIFYMSCEDTWNGIASFQGRAKSKTWCYCLARNALAPYKQTPRQKRGKLLKSRDDLAGQVREHFDRWHDTTLQCVNTTVKVAFREHPNRLTDVENMLRNLHHGRHMSWAAKAQIFASEDNKERLHDPIKLKKASNRLRQQFHQVKSKLKFPAAQRGLQSQRPK